MTRSIPHSRTRRGMTFVELLAVLVILGMIAGVLTVSFAGRFARGKREIARTQIAMITQAVETYRIEHGDWPPMEDGLAALTSPGASPTSAYFLKPEQIEDPWNRDYVFVAPGPDGYPFEVLTYGSDGQPGGEGESADLSSAALRSD
ncbi:MAG: type II secretion system major pseudopilin GspG [Planctomycetota bacterium]